MPTLTTIIQRGFGSLSHSNQRRNRNKKNPNRKRRSKIVIFAEDMIIYIETPKDATRKLLEQINEFGRVAGYKWNAQKSLTFLYTNDEKSEREIKETLPFIIATKIILDRKSVV